MEMEQKASEVFDISYETFDTITKDNLGLIHDLAEKELKFSIGIYDSTISRADSLLKLIIPFISSWIIFAVYSGIQNAESVNIFMPASFAGIFCLLVALYFILSVYLPDSISSDGYMPDLLLTESLLSQEPKNRDRNFLFFVIESYQDRIEKNSLRNSKRVRRISRAIHALIATPLVSGLVLAISYFSQV